MDKRKGIILAIVLFLIIGLGTFVFAGGSDNNEKGQRNNTNETNKNNENGQNVETPEGEEGENEGEGGNNNNIRGTVTIADDGALVFNGSFQDHPGSNLNVSENGTLTVNDSLSIGTTTTSLEIKPRNIPQKFNVLINNQLTTKSSRYLIQPEDGNDRESIYLSLTTDEKLEEYKVGA